MRKEFLYNGQAHQGEFVKVCVFGVASIMGRAIGFHVLTENGAVFWRLPIHALCHRPDAPPADLLLLEAWDCFSYEVSAIAFDRLREMRVRARLPGKQWQPGTYQFTLDWHGSDDAEDAGDGGHKCAHVIALDNGNYAALPNNCLQWHCPAFITPFSEKPDYRTNTRVWKVERDCTTTDGYFYDFEFTKPLTEEPARVKATRGPSTGSHAPRGNPASTLRVAARRRDAERQDSRSHAERGNEDA